MLLLQPEALNWAVIANYGKDNYPLWVSRQNLRARPLGISRGVSWLSQSKILPVSLEWQVKDITDQANAIKLVDDCDKNNNGRCKSHCTEARASLRSCHRWKETHLCVTLTTTQKHRDSWQDSHIDNSDATVC